MAACWEWASARWWKIDFHTHTPASDDYGKGPDQAQLKITTPKDWLLNFMRMEIDCVAVTDHNTGAWIDLLKIANQELKQENHPDYRLLHIFPGVELTVNSGIHVLALFSCEEGGACIDSLLGAVRFRGTKGTSDGCTEVSLIQVLEEVHRLGGLSIPAHVDDSNGLFKVMKDQGGPTQKQVYEDKKIIAMELLNSSYIKPSIYVDNKISWSEVLGSDSHHPHGTAGQSYPGSRFTWVKMSKPSLEGLKLALIDGALSLKRSDSFMGNPNNHGSLAIEQISINDAKYLGRGSSFICCFNPWFNVIIGPRGTGKSTVLEFLRIVLQRKDELPDSLNTEFKKYSQISNSRQDEGLLTGNAALSIVYRKDGTRFRLRWGAQGEQSEIEEESGPDTWTLSQGRVTQRFPIRIFSQKQIFEMAKNPEALLKIVDDAPGVNYSEWKQKWNELNAKYLALRAQARQILASLKEEQTLLGLRDDLRRKLEIFEKSGHSEILKAYQLCQNQGKAITDWELTWKDKADKVKAIASDLVISGISQPIFSDACAENEEFLAEVMLIQNSFQGIQEDITNIVVKVEQVREKWAETKDNLGIIKKIEEAKTRYSNLLIQLTQAGAGTPDEYGAVVDQVQQVEEKITGFVKQREVLGQLEKEASDCFELIQEHRKKITNLRDSFLSTTLDGNQYVQIQVVPFGNQSSIQDEFRALIDRSNGGFERDIGSVDGEEGLLSELYPDGQANGIDQRIEVLKTKIFSIHQGNDALAKDRRFAAHIQGLSPERLDRLMCWFPEDLLSVLFRSKDDLGLKPVKQGSPGQKTAALLAFLLSYGEEPLILDQPEDDLDNYLISDLIVTQIRENKQRRQVVVVTHNANIVVNGDAENVLALDVRSGRTSIVAQGGLQEVAIRDEICRVVEGGKEAFDQRYKRINAGR